MPFNTLYTLQIAERVQEITRRHYEPGRQNRNYRAVWKHYIRRQYYIGYRTYLRYIKIDVEAEKGKLNNL
jgi:hypothetical protein